MIIMKDNFVSLQRLLIQLGDAVIIFRITLNARPEKQKEVMQTLLSMSDPPGKKNNYLSYDIFYDVEDNLVFNIISEWETRQCLNHHIKSDKFGVLLGTKSLLSEPIKIQIFTVSDSEGIEAVYSVRKNQIPRP